MDVAWSNQRGPRQMSERDTQELSWVDDWLRMQPMSKWTSLEWKFHFFKLSTTLSYLLRHGAKAQGLTIRRDGYLPVLDLLTHRQLKDCTEAEIVMAVEKNAKQRFALKREGEVLLICAQQGHSKKVGDIDQLDLTTPLYISALPELVIHGTRWDNLASILTHGLSKMDRDHIHMADGFAATSGIRKESDTILKINAQRAITDGIKFWLSGNGVILTQGRDGMLPPEYIECVMDHAGRKVPKQHLPVPFQSLSPPMPKALPKDEAILSQSGIKRKSSANSSAPLQTGANIQPPSNLSFTEKEFLKVAKKVRAILKLKQQEATGSIDILQRNQRKKMDTWDEVLVELRKAERNLSQDTHLRQNNADVLACL